MTMSMFCSIIYVITSYEYLARSISMSKNGLKITLKMFKK